MFVLGIVGSRRRNSDMDYKIVRGVILEYMPDKIISGECSEGADKFAKSIASELGIAYKGYPPELPPKGSPKYEFTKTYYARNELIAKNSHMLVALVSKDRTGGTENTIKHFLKCNFSYNLIIK